MNSSLEDYKYQIEKSFLYAKKNSSGKLASYIPELENVNPDLFSVCITLNSGEQIFYGDANARFTLQSTSKPFVYAMAFEVLGELKLLKHVGVEPTGEAFDSIIELEKQTHRPYNPMINSGAIAISNLLAEHYQTNREKELYNFLNQFSAADLKLNSAVFQSEKSTANRNRAIAYLLKNFKIVPFDIELGLDFYFQQCSLEANVKDLSVMAATLAAGGMNPLTQKRCLSSVGAQKTLSLIMTCGMYDTAGEWAYSVGVPAKSGVSGAIFAVIPGVMGIAAFSPLINQHGHSLRGYDFISDFVQRLNMNIFNGRLS